MLHEHMQRCSKSAALGGKSVVLLVRDTLGDECLQDVTAFMKEGVYVFKVP